MTVQGIKKQRIRTNGFMQDLLCVIDLSIWPIVLGLPNIGDFSHQWPVPWNNCTNANSTCSATSHKWNWNKLQWCKGDWQQLFMSRLGVHTGLATLLLDTNSWNLGKSPVRQGLLDYLYMLSCLSATCLLACLRFPRQWSNLAKRYPCSFYKDPSRNPLKRLFD